MKAPPIRTKSDEVAIAQGCYFDWEEANQAEFFFSKHLTLQKGINADQKIELMDFQRDDIIYPTVAWKNANGTPRFKSLLINLAKKNGKSAAVAFLCLYMLLFSKDKVPCIALVGSSEAQAREVLFEVICHAIKSNSELSDALDITRSKGMIYYPANKGKIKIVASTQAIRGWDFTAVIVDEVANHRNNQLIEALRNSMAARPNRHGMIFISNQSFDRTHFYRKIYEHHKAVLTGENLDISVAACIHELPCDADWRDDSLYHIANPAITKGILDINEFRSLRDQAIKDKSLEMSFRMERLNQWVDKAEQYLSVEDWDRCQGAFPDLSQETAIVGTDLSATTDLTSVCAVWNINNKVYVKSYNFVPRKALEREGQNTSLYNQFALDGSLILTEGDAMDYARVRECIKNIPGKVHSVTFDKWQALESQTMLRDEGYEVNNFPQRSSYFTFVMKKLVTLINERKIVHDGNLCLRWCINNVQCKVEAKELLYPYKSSYASKIDSVIALYIALHGLYATMPSTLIPKKSVYENRPVRTI